jgi:RHS repeat-associated protein
VSFLYSVQLAGLRTEKFTGKEEDTDVGLHYFGARYYSAYLGRWISPDPPVVHGSAAGANHFQYAANAPYIAIDPDGNWVNVLIGAIVGSIVGSANEIIKRGGIRSIADAGWVILAGIRGGGIGAAAGSGNAWLAAAASTADQQVQMMYDSGGDMSILTQAEFHKQSAVVFGSSVAASYAGQGIGRLKGGMAFNAAASYAVGVGTAAANQMVLTGRGLRGEDWERFLKDQAISSTVSFGGSLVGEEIRTGLSGGAGDERSQTYRRDIPGGEYREVSNRDDIYNIRIDDSVYVKRPQSPTDNHPVQVRDYDSGVKLRQLADDLSAIETTRMHPERKNQQVREIHLGVVADSTGRNTLVIEEGRWIDVGKDVPASREMFDKLIRSGATPVLTIHTHPNKVDPSINDAQAAYALDLGKTPQDTSAYERSCFENGSPLPKINSSRHFIMFGQGKNRKLYEYSGNPF